MHLIVYIVAHAASKILLAASDCSSLEVNVYTTSPVDT